MLRLVDDTTGSPVGDGAVIDIATVGTGPALLLLHGVEGAQANRDLIECLAPQYEVIAPSHPGFDLSPQPRWCDSVDDLAYLYLDWLKSLGHDQVVLVGLQFGGWIAAEMAVRSTERLAGLVLVDTLGVKIGDRETADIADVFALSPSELDERTFFDPAFRDSDFVSMPEEEVMRRARNEEALVHYGWEPYMHNPKLLRRAKRIDKPALFVWGDHDGIVSVNYGREFAAHVPNSTFRVIDNAGHRPQIERPEVVASFIHQFVEGVLSPEGQRK